MEVELRFRPINEAKRVKADQLVRAVHVTAPCYYDNKDRALVANLFRGQRTYAKAVNQMSTLPMEMVPQLRDVFREQTKWHKKKKAQQQFLASVKTKIVRNTFVKGIHRYITPASTMRDMLACIRMPQTTQPLFLSVDQGPNAPDPIVTYWESQEEEVEHALSGLMVTVLQCLPKEFSEEQELHNQFCDFFTAEAYEAYEEQRWDYQQDTFTTVHDEYLASSNDIYETTGMAAAIDDIVRERAVHRVHQALVDLSTVQGLAHTDVTDLHSYVCGDTFLTADLQSLAATAASDDDPMDTKGHPLAVPMTDPPPPDDQCHQHLLHQQHRHCPLDAAGQAANPYGYHYRTIP